MGFHVLQLGTKSWGIVQNEDDALANTAVLESSDGGRPRAVFSVVVLPEELARNKIKGRSCDGCGLSHLTRENRIAVAALVVHEQLTELCCSCCMGLSCEYGPLSFRGNGPVMPIARPAKIREQNKKNMNGN